MAQYLISVWHSDTYEVDFSTRPLAPRLTQVSDRMVILGGG